MTGGIENDRGESKRESKTTGENRNGNRKRQGRIETGIERESRIEQTGIESDKGESLENLRESQSDRGESTKNRRESRSDRGESEPVIEE